MKIPSGLCSIHFLSRPWTMEPKSSFRPYVLSKYCHVAIVQLYITFTFKWMSNRFVEEEKFYFFDDFCVYVSWSCAQPCLACRKSWLWQCRSLHLDQQEKYSGKFNFGRKKLEILSEMSNRFQLKFFSEILSETSNGRRRCFIYRNLQNCWFQNQKVNV